MAKKSVWKEIAGDLGGIYEKGTFTKMEKIRIPHGESEIVIDNAIIMAGTTPITYTRIRSVFVNPSQFEFKIYHEGFFSSVGKMLGMQDILIGDEKIDETFVIKSKSEYQIQKLLSDPELKVLLLTGKPIQLEIKLRDGELQNERESILQYQASGQIKDIDVLQNIIEIFKRVIDLMIEFGIALDTEPVSKLTK